jgi:hypothetical protein
MGPAAAARRQVPAGCESEGLLKAQATQGGWVLRRRHASAHACGDGCWLLPSVIVLLSSPTDIPWYTTKGDVPATSSKKVQASAWADARHPQT